MPFKLLNSFEIMDSIAVCPHITESQEYKESCHQETLSGNADWHGILKHTHVGLGQNQSAHNISMLPW